MVNKFDFPFLNSNFFKLRFSTRFISKSFAPSSFLYPTLKPLSFPFNFSTKKSNNDNNNPKDSPAVKPTINEFFLPSEELVQKGKEKIVGSWLLLTAGSVLVMILLGGYTRLSKSGLSMTKWKPIAYKYPSNQQEWDREFENYKVIIEIPLIYNLFL